MNIIEIHNKLEQSRKDHDLTDYEKLKLLDIADMIFKIVMDSGGDGDGSIICKLCDYKKVANFLQDNYFNKTHLKRDDFDDSVIFSYDQESIEIRQLNSDTKPHVFDDITIVF